MERGRLACTSRDGGELLSEEPPKLLGPGVESPGEPGRGGDHFEVAMWKPAGAGDRELIKEVAI